MKLFKTVFILLIGMISMTAMATTPLLDENQKSNTFETVELTMVKVADVVSVDFEIKIHQMPDVGKTITLQADVILATTESKISIVEDVGWRCLPNSRLTMLNYVIETPFKQLLKQKIPIRS